MSRAKTIDLHKRTVKAISKDKRKNVYTNGIDDNYPERIELIINNSVTAKMGANKMASFIIGNGFKQEELNDKILNNKKGLTAYKILRMLANSLTRHKGAFPYVNYNAALEVDIVDVLTYKNVRKQKEDDIDNEGKLFYSDQWCKPDFSFNKRNRKSKWYYPFTTDEKVTAAQFKSEGIEFNPESDENINNFRGQVFFMNLEDENVYPLAFIDPAYNDADSEYHSSLFRNNQLKNGFTDKQIFVVRKGEDVDGETQVEKVIVDMMGSDGSNVGMIEVTEQESEDLSKYLHVEKLGREVDAERFKYFDDENESKILQSFENIPPSLVLGNDTSLLGDGGKKLNELKLNYSQDVAYIRVEIEQFFKKIFPNEDWSIAPLIEGESIETTGDIQEVTQE
jgi:hypothetical protein